MIAPVKPYEGREPYIFISYSHKDSDRVFPILKYLDEKGYRIWYDEGIDPGTEWPESIAQHLMHSAVCIAFISENSLASQNCRREINFALSRNQIGFLSVMLEDAKMTPGVELQLSTYQSLLMYKYRGQDEFYDKLIHVDLLEPCKRPQEAAVQQGPGPQVYAAEGPSQTAPAKETKPVKESKPAKEPRAAKPEKPAGGGANKKMLIIGGAAVAVIALIVAIIMMTSGKSEADPTKSAENTTAAAQEGKESDTKAAQDTTEAGTGEQTEAASQAGSQAEPETPAAPLELSEKLSDFTFKLDDVVYQLPFAFTQLTDNGWTISSSGVTDQTAVAAGGVESLQMVKNGASVTVYAVNAGKEEKAVADCRIGGIEVQQKDIMEPERFCVAKGITPFSKMDEITGAFGTGADVNTYSTSVKLTYGTVKTACTSFNLNTDTEKYNQIGVYHYPSAGQAERLSDLSDDPADYTFKLDGVVYQLPFAFTELTDNGWTISTSGVSDKMLVGGIRYEYFDMTKNGASLTVYVINASGNARPVGECQVGGIEVRQKQILDAERFCVAKGITPFSALDEIKAAYGDADDSGEYSNYVSLTYGDLVNNIYTKFLVYSDTVQYNQIKVQNFPTEPEPTDTVTEAPAYLSSYQAPAALGEDAFSGIVEIDGDLYQIPAPVSAFLDNGWVITRKSGTIPAFGDDLVSLEREGSKLEVKIKNLAEVQTVAENCIVIKAEMDADNAVTCTLPQEVAIGLRKSFLDDKELGFDSSEYSKYYYYYKTEKQTGVTISLHVTKEDDQINSIVIECSEWK